MEDRFDWRLVRAQIAATKRLVYLNSGWSGPSPRTVIDRITAFLNEEAEASPTAPEFLDRVSAQSLGARAALALTFGAYPSEIALLENTTEGVNVVINGMELGAGDEVVTCNFEHPAVLIPLYQARDRRGVGLRIVHVDFADDPEAVVAKFAAAFSSRTRLLAISHISYSAGMRLPLDRLIELAHGRGAAVLVDAAQSAGHIAVDLHALDVDYYALTGHKWLLGPDGVGALYVKQDRIRDLVPHKIYSRGALDFDYEGHWTPNPDVVQKFELTTASPALLSGFVEALAIYRKVGAGAIEERTRTLGHRLRAQLAAIPGVTVLSPADPRLACGLVVFQVEGLAPEDITGALWAQNQIICRTLKSPLAVRAACHYWNSEEEIDRTAAAVAELA